MINWVVITIVEGLIETRVHIPHELFVLTSEPSSLIWKLTNASNNQNQSWNLNGQDKMKYWFC